MPLIGIYQIRNINNNKIYIGSTINYNKRRSAHKSLLKNNKHHSIYLQNAWNKYGENSFVFDFLIEIDKKLLIENEQFYIDTLKPQYNMLLLAGSATGHTWTEEQKRKVSGKNHHNFGQPGLFKGHTHDESKELNKQAHLGKTHTEETILKMRDSKLGSMNYMYGKKHNIKTISKIKNSKLGSIPVNRKQVCQYDLTDNLIKTWDSISVAAGALNICNASISKCCRKITKSAGNYIWKYGTEKECL